MSAPRAALLPLFLISAASVGFEIALTRYFAVAKWSEYGYWVISIVMVGFAFSGVVLALFRDAFVRRASPLLTALPILLIAAAALGYHLTSTNPFNPLQLQNHATWRPELLNILGYYACLLPFFFLTGLFIGLTFVLNDGIIGRVYGYDLTGAGAGALATLLLMYLVRPFMLVPALLLPLAASAFATGRRPGAIATALAALLACEALLIFDNQADFNDFKAIYAPLHTPNAKIVAERLTPRGDYQLLDDFTERVDTDVSNDAGMLGLPGPPRTFGLYRDGNRIAALPKPGGLDVGYARAALDALPYMLLDRPRVLLAGPSGGFRVREALALGAAHVTALEPDPVLRDALRHGLGPSAALAADERVRISGEAPLSAVEGGGGGYDLIDISADFLDAGEANGGAFTTEAMAADLRALAPGGLLSVPASIRDFPVYALRVLGTARAALLEAGATDPALHVVIYRSAWNVRVLIAPQPWTPARIAAVRQFCDDRSFDVSHYPGMNVAAARSNIYNDLPAVSFEAGEVVSNGPDDSIADEALAVLTGARTPSARAFNLAPITPDRPAFYAVLRLGNIETLLRRLEILPQAEVGALVNLAVLGQAILLAALVLLVPLLAPGRVRRGQGGLLRAMLYFPALGLGFLFIEIFLIEQAAFYLNDRTTAFGLVLTGMLVCSGIGSMITDQAGARPGRLLALVSSVTLAWLAIMLLGLHPFLVATLSIGWLARAAIVLLILAPVSVALGLPFPLGLARAGSGGALPWAWGLNGAFSVVASPLANLIGREAGFSRLLIGAGVLYGLAWLSFPKRKQATWQETSARSPVAD